MVTQAFCRFIVLCFILMTAMVSGPRCLVAESLPEKVSYYEHVRPIFQAKCQGCHQPAKAQSGYIITEVSSLIAGGDSSEAVVPTKPAESYLIEMVTQQEGDDRPAMPPQGDPLTSYELSLVTHWIEQGALDDTPTNAKLRYNKDHPPQYSVPPIVTSMDYSPNGDLLAIAAFHEVRLHKADSTELVARLVGLSERIETVRFSPDGEYLAVAGGLPGRMGELQIWDVSEQELVLSKPVGYDTAYGASWSPDGNFIAIGLPDNTLRAIKVSSGEQTLFMGSHNDWVLDTAWSQQGNYLVSVGRDMSMKLTEVETERFIDNITSITPGALRGGLNAVDRHPQQDHVLVGGADGVPQIYRMHRETVRRIGDNANLIRKYPPMKGRIWGVAFAPDGNSFAAVSSLNGSGQIGVYKSAYDATITEELKKLFETARRNPNENITDPTIEEFHTRGAERLHAVDVDSAIFSVAFSPDGKTVAAASADGKIHLLDIASGEIRQQFLPVHLVESEQITHTGPRPSSLPVNLKKGKSTSADESLPNGRQVTSLEISPARILLDTPYAYHQLLVTATLDSGDTTDLTGMVTWTFDQPLAEVADRGLIRPTAEGETALHATYDGISAQASVTVRGMDSAHAPDFIRDVNPVISRLGCNAGTCHGSKDGKNGFKLSLRGYDALFDVRAFGDDHAARRVNFASPDDSLMLLKATGAVPHEGSVVTDMGSDYYNTIRGWIANGAKVDMASPRVTQIELFPQNPVVQNIGAIQQMRVVAHYADGTKRDVTRESIIESGNTEIAVHDDFGRVSTVRRGEAPVLARFSGAYAATTLTVMGNREGFVWEDPETWNTIDQLVAKKWERMRIRPSDLTLDTTFLRRVYLDLTGLPPRSESILAFLADERPTTEKRAQVIDSLIGSPAFVDHWTNKWADMLQVNSKFLGGEGANLFRTWIHDHVSANTPYNEFVFSILTASGSNKENPAASYYKILRTPEQLVENTTHLFLATRFNCNKCHDHPFERWNVDNYYQTAAFFAQVDLQRDTQHAPEENIGGSAVEVAQPLYEIVSDQATDQVTNIVTGETARPTFPFEAALQAVSLNKETSSNEETSLRQQLATWLTSSDNQYFAKSYANRIWAYLTGTGLIEPIDDIRAGNPPTNPELLDYLTRHFVESNFNVRTLMREICNSRTYQLSIETNPYNADDDINFSRGKARRLPAEVLFDSVFAVTGSTPNIPGAEEGTRAAQLADAKLDTKSRFLANLGRPPRESACECERQNDVELSAVMTLLNSPAIAHAIADPENAIAKLVSTEPDDQTLIRKIYLRVFGRYPSEKEVSLVLDYWSRIDADHEVLLMQIGEREAEWAVKKAGLEKERFVAIEKAQSDLDTYIPEHKQKKAEAEKAQQEGIAAADKAIQEYESNVLPEKLSEWMKGLTIDRFWTTWQPLKPTSVEATEGFTLTVQDNLSVLASGGPVAKTDYTLTIPITSATINGLMLEVIPHDSLTNFGPGIHKNGNFVLTEVQMSHTRTNSPDEVTQVKFVDARADFNQNTFDVKNAINDKLVRDDKGWAIGGQNGQTGRPHWARFQLQEPIAFDDMGGQLTIKLFFQYSGGEYPLGCFRLWTTHSSRPLELGLPAEVAAVLAMSPENRLEEQKSHLMQWFRDQQPDYYTQRFARFKESRPLPSDKRLQELTATLETTKQEIPVDPQIIQLRNDVQHSIEQTIHRRLTAAQDLTWALINNSAFLFNH